MTMVNYSTMKDIWSVVNLAVLDHVAKSVPDAAVETLSNGLDDLQKVATTEEVIAVLETIIGDLESTMEDTNEKSD